MKKCSHWLLVRVDLFSTRVSLVDYFSRKFSLDDIFSYCFQHGPIQSMWTFFQLTKNWLESGVISKIWLTFVPSSFWSNISLPGLKFPKVWYLHFQFSKYVLRYYLVCDKIVYVDIKSGNRSDLLWSRFFFQIRGLMPRIWKKSKITRTI